MQIDTKLVIEIKMLKVLLDLLMSKKKKLAKEKAKFHNIIISKIEVYTCSSLALSNIIV
jgi:hypothetical protein